MRRRHLEHELDYCGHFLTEMVGNAWVLPFDNFLIETLHVIGSEGWDQGAQLVK